jgi:hypothetical protein
MKGIANTSDGLARLTERRVRGQATSELKSSNEEARLLCYYKASIIDEVPIAS